MQIHIKSIVEENTLFSKLELQKSAVALGQFDAIHIVDNLAVVDPDKCTACGMCVDVCPQHTIELVPAKHRTFVKCKSKDKG